MIKSSKAKPSKLIVQVFEIARISVHARRMTRISHYARRALQNRQKSYLRHFRGILFDLWCFYLNWYQIKSNQIKYIYSGENIIYIFNRNELRSLLNSPQENWCSCGLFSNSPPVVHLRKARSWRKKNS